MKTNRAFKNLLKSEIAKVNRFVQKRDGKDSQITGWSCQIDSDDFLIKVRCEICSNDMSEREDDAFLHVFMPDRRKSWVSQY